MTVSGWAVDRAAPSGTGIDYVDVWAWQIHSPDEGYIGASTFLGRCTTGAARGDIAGAFGAQFANSGFSVTGNLPAGNYRLRVTASNGVGTGASSAMSNAVAAR